MHVARSVASLCAPLAALSLATAARAQEGDGRGASDVFRRFAERVVKVEISETGSGAKAELGSGFYVTPAGHVVTNYHVVARIVHDPGRYRAELVDAGGARAPVTVLTVDVVHDLAVLASGRQAPAWFPLAAPRLAQGQRLFALGHPHDLGLSIVEGTYNGLLEHTLYPRIHFTGSLNPGMSGGPAITSAGAVVGINVSTAGNQVSFLVPVERAADLVARATAPGFRPPDTLLAEVGRQLREHQDVYVRALFADSVPTVALGSWRLPTHPAAFFNCWADADRDPESPYEVVDHSCSTDDYVFVSRDHATGVLEFEHRLLTSDRLNRFQFAALYGAEFRRTGWPPDASTEDVTPFTCEHRNVRTGDVTFKTQFCLRRYRKFAGLYDAVLRAAPLGGSRAGVVTTLTLAGVSFENAVALVRRYLGGIAWAR
jgi:S1-C subfamily serine protease